MRSILALLALAVSLSAYSESDTAYIHVTADGWVEAVPDMISLTVILQETGDKLEDVRESVDKTTQQVVAAAREQGVQEDDIDSSLITVRPEFEWREGSRRYLGERVQRNVVLKIRETDRFGALVQELTRLDVHEVQTPQLQHSRYTELQFAALEAALQRGREKAERIARTLGVELGPVLRVEERTGPIIQPRMMAAEAMRADSSAPTFNFGKQRINADVEIRFAID